MRKSGASRESVNLLPEAWTQNSARSSELARDDDDDDKRPRWVLLSKGFKKKRNRRGSNNRGRGSGDAVSIPDTAAEYSRHRCGEYSRRMPWPVAASLPDPDAFLRRLPEQSVSISCRIKR